MRPTIFHDNRTTRVVVDEAEDSAAVAEVSEEEEVGEEGTETLLIKTEAKNEKTPMSLKKDPRKPNIRNSILITSKYWNPNGKTTSA